MLLGFRFGRRSARYVLLDELTQRLLLVGRQDIRIEADSCAGAECLFLLRRLGSTRLLRLRIVFWFYNRHVSEI